MRSNPSPPIHQPPNLSTFQGMTQGGYTNNGCRVPDFPRQTGASHPMGRTAAPVPARNHGQAAEITKRRKRGSVTRAPRRKLRMEMKLGRAVEGGQPSGPGFSGLTGVPISAALAIQWSTGRWSPCDRGLCCSPSSCARMRHYSEVCRNAVSNHARNSRQQILQVFALEIRNPVFRRWSGGVANPRCGNGETISSMRVPLICCRARESVTSPQTVSPW